ncbi:MAG: hypothetical protein N2Z23_09865 [Pyrinomonadaceae bacterium]|nr:hypothetical protein [Pyrinomonadaceae bacterium]
MPSVSQRDGGNRDDRYARRRSTRTSTSVDRQNLFPRRFIRHHVTDIAFCSAEDET